MSLSPLPVRPLLEFTSVEPVTEVRDHAPKQQASNREKITSTFFSTFITIFLAELGDKTQVATLLMSAESHAPWVVFTGAAMALIATSLIGVLVGQWLSSRLSPRTLEVATGLILLGVSFMLVMDLLATV